MKKKVYKYYKGEAENPYDKQTDYAKSWFWHGEMMYAHGEERHGKWVEDWTNDAKEWRKRLKGRHAQIAAKYTDEQLGIMLYTDLLYGKWNPWGYDPEMIWEY